MKALARIAALGASVVIIDQVTKLIANTRLRPLGSVEVIPNLFNLSYVENIGAAWGMLAGRQLFLVAFSIVTLALIIWKRDRIFEDCPCPVLVQGLLYGGIVGNLIDRAVRGRVVDFLDFHWGASHFPAFNVADSAICVSVFLLIVLQFFTKKPKGVADGQ